MTDFTRGIMTGFVPIMFIEHDKHFPWEEKKWDFLRCKLRYHLYLCRKQNVKYSRTPPNEHFARVNTSLNWTVLSRPKCFSCISTPRWTNINNLSWTNITPWSHHCPWVFAGEGFYLGIRGGLESITLMPNKGSRIIYTPSLSTNPLNLSVAPTWLT